MWGRCRRQRGRRWENEGERGIACDAAMPGGVVMVKEMLSMSAEPLCLRLIRTCIQAASSSREAQSRRAHGTVHFSIVAQSAVQSLGWGPVQPSDGLDLSCPLTLTLTCATIRPSPLMPSSSPPLPIRGSEEESKITSLGSARLSEVACRCMQRAGPLWHHCDTITSPLSDAAM